MNKHGKAIRQNHEHDVAERILRLFFIIIGTILLVLTVACTTHAAGRDSWTTADTAIQLVYATAHIMDWTQTLHIGRNSQQYEERGSYARVFIGRHPSRSRVNAFVGSTLLLHTWVAWMLPASTTVRGEELHPRALWQAVWIGIETDAVQHNRQIGLGVKLHF